MWKKIVKSQNLIFWAYLAIGIVLASEAYSFIVELLSSRAFNIRYLYSSHSIKLIVAFLVGGFAAVIVLYQLKFNFSKRTLKMFETKGFWYSFLSNILGFSIGGLIAKLIKNVFDILDKSLVFSYLYQYYKVYEYIAIVCAATVFALFYTLGSVKRLKLLAKNKK